MSYSEVYPANLTTTALSAWTQNQLTTIYKSTAKTLAAAPLKRKDGVFKIFADSSSKFSFSDSATTYFNISYLTASKIVYTPRPSHRRWWTTCT